MEPSHEHISHFTSEPFLPDRTIAALQLLLLKIKEPGKQSLSVLRNELESKSRSVDMLATFARHMMFGDRMAKEQFEWWMETCLCSEVENSAPTHSHVHSKSHSLDHSEENSLSHQHASGSYQPFNLGPVIDILAGAAYHACENPQTLSLYLDNLQAYFTGFIPFSEKLYAIATTKMEESFRNVSLQMLISQCQSSKDGKTDELPNAEIAKALFKDCECMPRIDRLIEIWKRKNPVTEWIKLISEENLNTSLAGVSPNVVSPGEKLTLLAAKQKPFSSAQPEGVGVFFYPGVEAKVLGWTSTAIEVEVPEGALSGFVQFENVLSETDEKYIHAAEHEMAELAGPTWAASMICLEHLNTLVHPACGVSGKIEVSIMNPPMVSRFAVVDEKGKQLEKIDAGSAVVSWQVRSDSPVTKVSILFGGKEILGNLPLEGAIPVSVTELLRERNQYPVPEAPEQNNRSGFTITATNGRHETSQDFGAASGNLRNFATLSFTTPYTTVILERPDATGTRRPGTVLFILNLSRASSAPVTVTFTSSDPRVQVEHSTMVLPAGSRSAAGRIIATNFGEPGSPVATITATAEHYFEASIDVWVEPRDGVWNLVMDGGSPLRLPLMAIHAALLHTGKVMFFSATPEHHHIIHIGEWAVWDPETGAVVHEGMMDRNLFCAGHCFLPNGKLLVAGGHAPPRVFGWNADHDVHLFDPERPFSPASWIRLHDMPQGRWYPTCTQLPTGRVLIVSGSSGGAPPFPLFTINENYDMVDQDMGTLEITQRDFLSHPDMYPFLFVLPGGNLFFHSRDISRIFINDETLSRQLKYRVSPHRYPTESLTTRTYPGQSACVMLPLVPGTDNRITGAKLMVVGGGGSLRSSVRGEAHLPHAHEEAVDTCEVFDYNASLSEASLQRGWSNTGRLNRGRFMADAVLLPDGNILAVGGTAKGKADHNDDPVLEAELYSPRTGTWQLMAPMTVARRYHATTLLLPDGRVMSAGGTASWPPHHDTNEFRMELFSPGYLFRGPRPQIGGIAVSMGYDMEMTISTPDWERVRYVIVIRASSTTHTLNMDQRYVQCIIEGRSENEIRFRTPIDPTVAPQGWYMLFLVTGDKIPSESVMVQLTI